MPTATDGDGSGNVIPSDPPKRPWTTPGLVIHGTIPSQTFVAGSIPVKQAP